MLQELAKVELACSPASRAERGRVLAQALLFPTSHRKEVMRDLRGNLRLRHLRYRTESR